MSAELKACLVLALLTVGAVPMVASLPRAGNWTWLSDAEAISRMEQRIDHANNEQDLVELAQKLGCNKFMAHLKHDFPDLMELLKSKGPFTVIVPTDEAFIALEREMLDRGEESLKPIFRGHVMRGRIHSSDVFDDLIVPSELIVDYDVVNVRFNIYYIGNGEEIITATGGTLTITDQIASNGVIHVTDRILYDQPLYDMLTELENTNPTTDNFFEAIGIAELGEAISDDQSFTLFAPSNEAWEALRNPDFNELMEDKMMLKQVLLNHFVMSGTLFEAGLRAGLVMNTRNGGRLRITEDKWGVHVNSATLTRPDVAAVNGVFHIIDRVLVPAKVKAYYKKKKALEKLLTVQDIGDDGNANVL